MKRFTPSKQAGRNRGYFHDGEQVLPLTRGESPVRPIESSDRVPGEGLRSHDLLGFLPESPGRCVDATHRRGDLPADPRRLPTGADAANETAVPQRRKRAIGSASGS